MNLRKLKQLFLFVLGIVVLSPEAALSKIVTLTDQDTGASRRLEEYITTHYDGTTFVPGGKEGDIRYKNREKDGQPFNDTLRPSYNLYFNQRTAETAIGSDAIVEFEKDVFEKSGYHCDILNYNETVPTDSYLLQDHANIQIVNNVRWHGTLITVYFPPYWNKSRKLPLLVTGRGYKDDNNTMYKGKQTGFAVWAGKSIEVGDEYDADNPANYGNQALIILQSNCGGRESQGINSRALKEIGDFIANVMPSWGGDPSRIIMMGGSRAGNTALVWAANPYNYAYKVQSVHAFSPPVKFGSMLTYSGATFPGILGELREILGSDDAYESDYLDEDSGRVMTPDEKARAAMKILLNETDRVSADGKSAYGYYTDPDLVPDLQEKRIVIAQGTHDTYMPMSCFLDFDSS